MTRVLVVLIVTLCGIGLSAQQPVDDRPRDPTNVTTGKGTTGQQPPSPAQEGFVPVDPSQMKEQIPAAPLVMSAYAVAWIAIFLYVWSIWQRLGKVEREIADLNRRVAAGGHR
jgi:CcmD family protein